MINIQFYSLLRLMLKRESIQIPAMEGDCVQTVLDRVQESLRTPMIHKLLAGSGLLHTGTIILLNRHNILHLNGLETIVADGDTLALFPPGAGG